MFDSAHACGRLCLSAVVTLAVASYSTAAVIPLIDPNTGLDSGWQASFPDNAQINLVVDAVTADGVFIQKFVDFEDPLGPGGLFPAANIDFTQTLPDGLTVSSIVIVDEGLTNLTGSDWNGFDFLVVGSKEAWFNVDLSSGFDTSPFADQTFGGFVGDNANQATTLRTRDGIVPNLGTFFPGAGSGELWIDIDLSLADITSFDLKQLPVPEPATLILLGIGAVVAVRRRVRR